VADVSSTLTCRVVLLPFVRVSAWTFPLVPVASRFWLFFFSVLLFLPVVCHWLGLDGPGIPPHFSCFRLVFLTPAEACEVSVLSDLFPGTFSFPWFGLLDQSILCSGRKPGLVVAGSVLEHFCCSVWFPSLFLSDGFIPSLDVSCVCVTHLTGVVFLTRLIDVIDFFCWHSVMTSVSNGPPVCQLSVQLSELILVKGSQFRAFSTEPVGLCFGAVAHIAIRVCLIVSSMPPVSGRA
jgi:hypothetical protein